MSKLLSDEELYEKLEEMHYKLENTQHTNWDEYTNTLSGFTDLINTQKRLYAEMVVGEYFESPDGYPTEYNFIRNELIQEQRGRIK